MVKAMPVTPTRSQADLPDTTALKATTNSLSFLPAKKNSERPEEENLAERIPMIMMRKRYKLKERTARGFAWIAISVAPSTWSYSPSSLKKANRITDRRMMAAGRMKSPKISAVPMVSSGFILG
jgi:hypothetical protein